MAKNTYFVVMREARGVCGTVYQNEAVTGGTGYDVSKEVSGSGVRHLFLYERKGDAEDYVRQSNNLHREEGNYARISNDGTIWSEWVGKANVLYDYDHTRKDYAPYVTVRISESDGLNSREVTALMLGREETEVGIDREGLDRLPPDRRADAERAVMAALNRYGREINDGLKKRNITFDGWEDVERYASDIQDVEQAGEARVRGLKDDLVKGVTTKASLDDKGIRVYFKDGRDAAYPAGSLDMFKAEDTVSMITDERTGEVVYEGRQAKETYAQMADRHQAELSRLPIKFAFSDEQFAEGMKELGLTPEDTGKVTRVGASGFMRDEDVGSLHEMTDRHRNELEAAIRSDATGEGFIYEMFKHDLANVEFGYHGDLDEFYLNGTRFTEAEIKADPALTAGLEKAVNDYPEYGWMYGDYFADIRASQEEPAREEAKEQEKAEEKPRAGREARGDR